MTLSPASIISSVISISSDKIFLGVAAIYHHPERPIRGDGVAQRKRRPVTHLPV
jgi:hypothetical protein